MNDFTLRLRVAAAAIVCSGLLAVGGAWAGGVMGDDDHDDSRNVVGFVRDVGSGPLADARVTAALKASSSTFVTRADTAGHYRITGFAADIVPDAVEVNCTKDGYRQIRMVLRNPKAPPEAPIEVDCLMEKGAPAPDKK